MALPILDGNQSATTLSTILSSGQHITAHTVVSLGTQAITDISGAVSGSVVSISNFPATQTIAGTVTAFGEDTVSGGFLPIPLNDGGEAVLVDIKGAFGSGVNVPISGTVTANVAGNLNGTIENYDTDGTATHKVAVQIYDPNGQALGGGAPLPISGTVTVGSLPAISGTVTANLSSSNLNTVTIGVRGSVTVGNTTQITDNVVAGFNNIFGNNDTLKVDIRTPDGSVLDGEASVPVQGTVDIGSLPAISGTVTANLDANSPIIASQVETGIASYAADLANEPLPISGTVTVGNSVTIASFATSVTARLINPAGTAVTYAEVGTAGSPSIDVLSVQGVTSGTAIPISISSVTIGSLPAISGTVTANLSISKERQSPPLTFTSYHGSPRAGGVQCG
jgi:hypothetical protein